MNQRKRTTSPFIRTEASTLFNDRAFSALETGTKGCGKALNLERQRDRLLKLFKDNTATPDLPGGRTTIAPHREPSPHSLRGYERPRVRKYSYVPRDT